MTIDPIRQRCITNLSKSSNTKIFTKHILAYLYRGLIHFLILSLSIYSLDINIDIDTVLKVVGRVAGDGLDGTMVCRVE